MDSFNIFLETLPAKLDVLCFSEHWLSEHNYIILNKIKDFKLVTIFCRHLTVRGGVCILAREDLLVEPLREVDNFSREGLFECCAVKVGCDRPVVIVALYRPPHNDKQTLDYFFLHLDRCLKVVVRKFKNACILLTGDFNIDTIQQSQATKDFLNVLESYSLKANVFVPTRVTATSQTCIDNVFTNFSLNHLQVFETGFSDHFAQISSIDISSLAKNKKCLNFTKRCFSKAAILNFEHALYSIDWEDKFKTLNTTTFQKLNYQFKIFMNEIRYPFFHLFR